MWSARSPVCARGDNRVALEPTARLSFRQRPQGGEVKPEPSEPEYRQLTGRRHLLLLIHGYNNDLKASEDAYQ